MKSLASKRVVAFAISALLLLGGCNTPADTSTDSTDSTTAAQSGQTTLPSRSSQGQSKPTQGTKKTTKKTAKKTTKRTTKKTTKRTTVTTKKTVQATTQKTTQGGNRPATTATTSKPPAYFISNGDGTYTEGNSGVVFLDDPCNSVSLGSEGCLLDNYGGKIWVDKTHPEVFKDGARFRREDATSSSDWWFSYHLSYGISEVAIVTYTNQNSAGDLIKTFDAYVSPDNYTWKKLSLKYSAAEDENLGSGWYKRTYKVTGLSKSNKYLKIQYSAVGAGAEFYVPNIGRVRINSLSTMDEFESYLPDTPQTTTTTKKTTTTTTKKTTTTTKPSTLNFTYPQKGKSYTGAATWKKTFYPPDSTRTKLQGSCYANGYWYVSFIKDDNPGSGVRIVKYTSNFQQVAMSEPLELDHANNLTYNTRTNQILVSHCQSNGRDRWNYYSLVDPNTLTITKTSSLPNPFFAMAYSPEKNMYGSARWGGETVDVWDGNLNHVRSFSVTKPQTLSQGAFCDANYIWFVRSETPACPTPELRLYNWDTGACEFVIPVTGLGGESESLHIIDGNLYVLLDGGACVGVFTVQLTAK